MPGICPGIKLSLHEFRSDRFRDGQPPPVEHLFGGRGRRAQRRGGGESLSAGPAAPEFLQPFQHGGTRSDRRRYRRGARVRGCVARDRRADRRAAARGAQRAVRRGVPAGRVRPLQPALPRLSLFLHLPGVAPLLRAAAAQPSAAHRGGCLRL